MGNRLGTASGSGRRTGNGPAIGNFGADGKLLGQAVKNGHFGKRAASRKDSKSWEKLRTNWPIWKKFLGSGKNTF